MYMSIVETILDPKSAQSSIVALTYAIYFAAVTALCHDDSEPMALPSEKHELLKRYKKSLDQLLMATELMNRPELVSLQALAIYATCLRVHEVGRSVWVLNGLAIRLAQSIGLHRDGASLQLSPFDTEIRLRLWWHLCVLDSRAPEDQGFQPTVDVINRGLRLPLNVNDNQIYPGMTRLPVESHDEHGRSLMAKYGMLPGDAAAASTDLLHIAIQHTATAHKKMQFVLQLREEVSMQKQKGAQGDSISDVEKRSFKLACEALECSRVLLREGIASRSGLQWFFKMYTQWYALAYVLRCLCGSPQGPETERAWTLVEELFPLGMSLDDEYWHGSIWSYLNLLRSQASSLRQYDQRPSTGGNEHSISSHTLPPDVKIPPSTDTPETTPTGAAHGTSGFSELDQELITDSNQTFFSSLDLSMPEFPFLPDWNAIINGCLINDIPEIDTYSCGDYPADIA
uniref:Putative transcriptional regulatory protein n=1 Tax=Talaromyces marneffei PM1 TaxID=1077442 RepID=A0A093VFG3_TALMA